MSAHIIAPEGALVDALSVERMRERGRLLTVGQVQGALMLRAHGKGMLTVARGRERAAAQRLVERGLLRKCYPNASQQSDAHRTYALTEQGAHTWLLVRGEQ